MHRGITRTSDNRFLENHEERMVEEQRFLRETAEEKYRRTHNYNIIAGEYYDQNKERNFVNSREKLGKTQGRAQQYRLPPSIRYGEGNDYNIINQQVRGSIDVRSLFPEILPSTPSKISVHNHKPRARNCFEKDSRFSWVFGVLRVLGHVRHFM